MFGVGSGRKIPPSASGKAAFYMSTIISGGLYRLLTEKFGVVGVPALLWLIPPVLLCAAGGYLLGSISSAVIVSRALYSDDIRRHGSGNAGMTNMFRTWGKKAGILTLVGDVVKTAVAVVLGYLWLGYMGAYLAGLFCMLGHMFPVFYKFRGGKGVLVAAVTIMLTEPMRIPVAVFLTVMILIMHRENFKRIYAGKEPKINFPWTRDVYVPADEDEPESLAASDGEKTEHGTAKRTVKKKSTYGKKKK